MTEIIRYKEVIDLLEIKTNNYRSAFNNIKIRNEDFPKRLYRDDKGSAYSRSEIMEYFNLDDNKKPKFFDFMTGKFDRVNKQITVDMKIMKAKYKQPKTQTVSIQGD